MIRPRSAGFSAPAPSQTTLRYLRQLVFPGGGGSGGGISNHCLRNPAPAAPPAAATSAVFTASTVSTASTTYTPPTVCTIAAIASRFGQYRHYRGDPVPPATVVDGGRPRPRPPRPPRRKDRSKRKAPLPPPTPDEDASAEAQPKVPTEEFRLVSLRDRLPYDECRHWYANLKGMMSKGEMARAKEIFFMAREQHIDEGMVQKAGLRLMVAFNSKAKHAEAPGIFAHMATFPEFVSTLSLNRFLEAYLIRKNYRLLVMNFRHYMRMNIVQPDHKTYELFVRCLAKTDTVQSARSVLMRLEEEGKPITLSSWAVFMACVRERKASFAELEQVFFYLKQKRGPRLSPALYNIMIEEALDRGKPAVAKSFVDMMNDDGVRPNEKTLSAFLRVQAKSGDWESVKLALTRARQNGMVFTSWTLNRLLDNYADLEQLDGLEAFFGLLCKDEALPTPASFNIMIRAHLVACDEQGVFWWVARMREAGFEPTATTFNTFFHDLRCADVPRSLLYRVYYTVFNIDHNKVDEFSRNILTRAVQPIKRQIAAPPRADRAAEEISVPYSLGSSRQVSKEMLAAIKAGAMQDALNIFREASSHVPITWDVIQPLARAYMLFPDTLINIPATLPKQHGRAEAIREAVAGLMVASVLAEANKTPIVHTSLLEIIFGLYKFMEANDLAISHNITYRTSGALINRQDPVSALYIMNEVSGTRWGRHTGWDIAGLTVLARAYLIMNDLPGITWVVDRLLETREVPDDLFFEYLKRGTQSSSSYSGDQEPGQPPPEFRQAVRELIAVCKKHKKRLWKDLHRRADGVVNAMDVSKRWDPPPPSVRATGLNQLGL
jgi:hypothetical protein